MNIYKYTLHPGEIQVIYCVKPISVIDQRGVVTLYVLIDDSPTHSNKSYQFFTAGTGWNLKDTMLEMTFLNTVKCDSSVWHIFYKELST